MSELKEFRAKVEAVFLKKLVSLGFEQRPEPEPDLNRTASRRRRKSKDTRTVKRLNDETDIFLYPGVDIYRGHFVKVSPVIGVENSVLRERTRNSGNSLLHNSNGRVCHLLVNSLAEREFSLLRPGDPMEDILLCSTDLIERKALPIMCKYDSTSKVRMLFRSHRLGEHNDGVAILGGQEKLRVLQDGWD